MSSVRDLYQVQLLDSEWDAKNQRLAEVNEELGESRELVQARESVAETEEALGRTRAQLRALELDIAGLNDKLRKNQDRLYSGKIRNPKELTGLQDEAAALRRRRSELEDEELELMIGIEELEAELAERQARLRQIEASWGQDQASLRAEKETLETELVVLGDERGAARARIDASTLAMYDDLRQRHGGTAVAVLKRGICQACGVDVPTNLARTVERGEGIHFCPICNRILYAG
ncbi:MAG: zinc ribbon domain-containing protein [Anaerolineae bacterium]